MTDDDEEFFSAEADDSIVTPSLGDELAIPNEDASGATSENNLLFSADLSGNDKVDPEESVSMCDSSCTPGIAKLSILKIRGMTRRKIMITTKMNQVPWTLMTATEQMIKTTNQMTNQKAKPRKEVDVTITTLSVLQR